MRPRHVIEKFWALHALGRSAALDLNTETGELICRHSVSDTGAEGLAAPGQPHSDCWCRVVCTDRGALARDLIGKDPS